MQQQVEPNGIIDKRLKEKSETIFEMLPKVFLVSFVSSSLGCFAQNIVLYSVQRENRLNFHAASV